MLHDPYDTLFSLHFCGLTIKVLFYMYLVNQSFILEALFTVPMTMDEQYRFNSFSLPEPFFKIMYNVKISLTRHQISKDIIKIFEPLPAPISMIFK